MSSMMTYVVSNEITKSFKQLSNVSLVKQLADCNRLVLCLFAKDKIGKNELRRFDDHCIMMWEDYPDMFINYMVECIDEYERRRLNGNVTGYPEGLKVETLMMLHSKYKEPRVKSKESIQSEFLRLRKQHLNYKVPWWFDNPLLIKSHQQKLTWEYPKTYKNKWNRVDYMKPIVKPIPRSRYRDFKMRWVEGPEGDNGDITIKLDGKWKLKRGRIKKTKDNNILMYVSDRLVDEVLLIQERI